jgi:hypothetical protein
MLAITMPMPSICHAERLCPSSAQPNITAVTGLRKASGAIAEGSSRATPRNHTM